MIKNSLSKKNCKQKCLYIKNCIHVFSRAISLLFPAFPPSFLKQSSVLLSFGFVVRLRLAVLFLFVFILSHSFCLPYFPQCLLCIYIYIFIFAMSPEVGQQQGGINVPPFRNASFIIVCCSPVIG